MEILNWGLIEHPINWLTVVLMVLIAGIAIHFFMSYKIGSNPASVIPSSKT